MAEETTTPISAMEATGTATTPATTPAVETPPPDRFNISNFIEPDGKFKEGWKDVLVPEDLRGEKFYDAWGTDVQSLIKVAGNQAKTIGKYAATKGVLPVNERSTPFEVQAFREAMNIPPDGSGYKFIPPEDISSEDLSPEFTKEAFTELNKAHYTQAQVDTAMKLYTDHLRLVEKTVEDELMRKVKDAQNSLESEYGDRLEERLQLSKSFITKMASGWNPEKYDMLFGKEVVGENGTASREGGINDPDFAPLRPLLLDLFATIEEKYGLEDSVLEPETTGNAVKDIEQQLRELEGIPGFMDGKLRTSMNPEDRKYHEQIMKKRHDLIARQVAEENKKRL